MDRQRSLGFLLKHVSGLFAQRFELRARALGLTLAQSKALVNLAKHQGMSQSQLAELIDAEPMNLLRIVDRMEADGWLERRADPADRRARRLYLKPKAGPLVDRIWELSDQTRAEALAGIPRPQIEQLIDLLEKMQGNLSAPPAIPAATGRKRAAAK
jgi:DNA-binding MarR family transcriptional regulator